MVQQGIGGQKLDQGRPEELKGKHRVDICPPKLDYFINI